ncbi:MAG: O-antigen ligase family protein, partial [Polyangiaceae bacterium]|nr:O-antigen ligase family protein [Polyangiaceae bacterium]
MTRDSTPYEGSASPIELADEQRSDEAAATSASKVETPSGSDPSTTRTSKSAEPVLGGFGSPRERRERLKKGVTARRTRRGPLDRWLELLLGVVVVGSVLAVGTVHVPTLLVIGTLSIACGALALHVYQRDAGRWPITLPAAGVLGLTAWTALQALPLPSGFVAAIAPHNADVWAHVLDPLGAPGPSWHPISLDPGATWVEALKGVTYLGVVVASSVIAHRRGAVFGVALVALSGVCAALFTIMHGLAGMTKVFGVYEPIHNFAPWHIGPLLNANHLAGYLNLAAMCGLGLLLVRHTRIPRWATGLGVATIVGVTVASASRGGVVVLPIGVAIVVLLLRTRSGRLPEHAVSNRWLNILTLSAIGGGAVLAWLGLTTKQWDELLSNDLSKLSILEWARPLLADHRLVGIGRGAFETVYPAYRPNVGHVLWTHPENVLAQWAAEWGVPVAVLAAVFFLWLLRPTRMGATRSAVAAGGVAGIAILVLQNWVDFSLELPGVAIAVVTVIGSCWGDTARRG